MWGIDCMESMGKSTFVQNIHGCVHVCVYVCFFSFSFVTWLCCAWSGLVANCWYFSKYKKEKLNQVKTLSKKEKKKQEFIQHPEGLALRGNSVNIYIIFNT